MSRLTTLLFDVDGTLAETEEIHRHSFNRCFAEAGLDWVWSKPCYAELLAVTGGKERIRYYLQRYRPDFRAPKAIDAFIADLHAAKTAIYTRAVAAGDVPLRPGVRRLLMEAREAGARLAITTTTTVDNVTALLQHSLAPDAERWFEVIGAGSVVPAKKPAPDIYHYVMEKMNVMPQECLALEDSANGLRSARAAGVVTLVTTSEYTRDERFDGAALVIDQLGEPGRPFTVVCGDAGGHRYVTLELLRELHAKDPAP
ncbi:MAG: HAD-IA family hydrolase [Gammaproteobacteria bacterium]|jgi:beta-phosphoglucomutase-like phosphatase (HAD superfamily)